MRWPKCTWARCEHPAAWCSRKTGKRYCGVEHGGPTYFQKKWAEMDQPLFGPPPVVLEQTAKTNSGVSPFCEALANASIDLGTHRVLVSRVAEVLARDIYVKELERRVEALGALGWERDSESFVWRR